MTITIPDFEDCPAWCNSIQVYFCQSRDPREAGKMGFAGIKVDRPVSPWIPGIDETVFFLHPSKDVMVGKVVAITETGVFDVTLTSGVSEFASLPMLKKFSTDKIGRPWEEI